MVSWRHTATPFKSRATAPIGARARQRAIVHATPAETVHGTKIPSKSTIENARIMVAARPQSATIPLQANRGPARR
eukprot:4611717-Pyramimonas_sp.AAC.1